MNRRQFISATALAGAMPQLNLSALAGTTIRDKSDWWRNSRFGMFIHWGPVSLKGTEIGWSRGGERRGLSGSCTGEIPVDEYDNLYRRFNPYRFDANEWVRVAKNAGMKYMVFTSRHHDGFSMFNSRLSDYSIMNSPYGKDICALLADACHRADFPIGWYYSQPDWKHPDYRTSFHDRYLDYLHGQVEELLTNYGRIDIMWFDGLGGTADDWKAEELFEFIHRLQPDILINNRCGLPGDFDTPEQRVGNFQTDRAWESCITIGNQWAWKPDDDIKTLKQCIQTLVLSACGDGNLLFNVGPMPDGRIEQRQIERLTEMGEWLGKFGESIYSTRGGPFMPAAIAQMKWYQNPMALWGSTYKRNRIYLHVFGWPADSISLPAIGRKIKNASLMTGGEIQIQEFESGINLKINAADQQEIDTIVLLEMDDEVTL